MMKWFYDSCLAVVAALALLPPIAPVFAAEAPAFGFPALTPAAYDFHPRGFEVANLQWLPSLTTSGAYNDNIFAMDTNTESDTIWEITPSLRATSVWEKHRLDMSFNLEQGLYTQNTDENYTDYSASIGGRWDVSESHSLSLRGQHEHEHYNRNSPEDFGGIEPTEYDRNQFEAGYRYNGPRLRLDTTIGLRKYEFDNAQTASGAIIDNQVQNRDELHMRAELGLSQSGVISPYLYVKHQQIDFEMLSQNNNFDRDADSIEYGAGSTIAVSDMTNITLNLGYAMRDSQDSALRDYDRLNYGFELISRIFPQTQIELRAEQKLDETALNNAAVSVDNLFGADFLFEPRADTLLTLSTDYLAKDFKGTQNQTLDRFDAGLGVTYKMHPELWLKADYRYTTQDVESTSPALRNYDRNLMMVSTVLSY